MITVYVDNKTSLIWFIEFYRIGYRFKIFGKTLEISNSVKKELYEYCKPRGLDVDKIIKHEVDEKLSENTCKWEVYYEINKKTN